MTNVPLAGRTTPGCSSRRARAAAPRGRWAESAGKPFGWARRWPGWPPRRAAHSRALACESAERGKDPDCRNAGCWPRFLLPSAANSKSRCSRSSRRQARTPPAAGSYPQNRSPPVPTAAHGCRGRLPPPAAEPAGCRRHLAVAAPAGRHLAARPRGRRHRRHTLMRESNPGSREGGGISRSRTVPLPLPLPSSNTAQCLAAPLIKRQPTNNSEVLACATGV